MKQINLLAAAFMLTVASAWAQQTFDWMYQTLYVKYAEDGVTETSRSESDYNDEGRVIGIWMYLNGTLYLQYRDYQYNELTATYWHDSYSGGNLSSSRKVQVTYHDKNWMRWSRHITYAEDGVTEAGRMEYDYDNDGRETGYRSYSNGTLYLQYRDYQYNELTTTYWYDIYSGGNVSLSTKIQRTYSDKNWIQQTLYIQYASDGVTEAGRVETDYDNDGRETGYRSYVNGTLSLQYSNYQYNGRTITCWIDTYSGGNVTSSTKLERTYASIASAPNSIENVASNNISIYPNPTSGILQIEDNEHDIQQVSIFDLSGIEVLNTKNSTIDISHFPAGMYIVRIATSKEILTKKIVKYDN